MILSLFSGCTTERRNLGGAEGIGGGDLFDKLLRDVRDQDLSNAAGKIVSGQFSGILCDFKCPNNENPLCKRAPSLSLEQRQYCANFVSRNILSLRERLSSAAITLKGVSEKLYVAGDEVTMRTTLSENGVIEISLPRTEEQNLTREEIGALLGHEFFHKLKDSLSQAFTPDGGAQGPFLGPQGGSDLLTAAGYALAFVAQGETSTPDKTGMASLEISDGPAYDFGTRPVGSTVSKALTLTNSGTMDATEINITLPSHFTANLGTCQGKISLPANASCSIEIKFEANTEGDYSDSVQVSYQDGKQISSAIRSLYGRMRTPLLYIGATRDISSTTTSVIRVRNAKTGAVVSGGVDNIAPFGSSYFGELRLALGDVNGDGKVDLSVAPSAGGITSVSTLDTRSGIAVPGAIANFVPYPGFPGGAFVGLADVDGDGKDDVVAGADAGGGAHLKSFSGISGAEIQSFFAVAPEFLGGIRVATGDLNGDHHADLIAVTGAGTEVNLKAFRSGDNAPLLDTAPYPTAAGGAYVASGDVNGDGRSDIIVAYGQQGGPHVKAYSGVDSSLLFQFMAYSTAEYDYVNGLGISLAVGDVNGDGKADIFTAPRGGGSAPIRMFNGADGHALYDIPTPDSSATSIFLGFSY